MIDLANCIEGVRDMILSMENCLTEFNKLKPETKSEILLRRKVIGYLQIASDSLLDAYGLLADAQACTDDGDLTFIVEQSKESEAEP